MFALVPSVPAVVPGDGFVVPDPQSSTPRGGARRVVGPPERASRRVAGFARGCRRIRRRGRRVRAGTVRVVGSIPTHAEEYLFVRGSMRVGGDGDGDARFARRGVFHGSGVAYRVRINLEHRARARSEASTQRGEETVELGAARGVVADAQPLRGGDGDAAVERALAEGKALGEVAAQDGTLGCGAHALGGGARRAREHRRAQVDAHPRVAATRELLPAQPGAASDVRDERRGGVVQAEEPEARRRELALNLGVGVRVRVGGGAVVVLAGVAPVVLRSNHRGAARRTRRLGRDGGGVAHGTARGSCCRRRPPRLMARQFGRERARNAGGDSSGFPLGRGIKTSTSSAPDTPPRATVRPARVAKGTDSLARLLRAHRTSERPLPPARAEGPVAASPGAREQKCSSRERRSGRSPRRGAPRFRDEARASRFAAPSSHERLF